MKIVEKSIRLYEDSPAFIEIFNPLLKFIESEKWEIAEIVDLLKENITKSGAARTSLQFQKHKPIPLQSLAPKFEFGYSLDRKYDRESEDKKVKPAIVSRFVSMHWHSLITEMDLFNRIEVKDEILVMNWLIGDLYNEAKLMNQISSHFSLDIVNALNKSNVYDWFLPSQMATVNLLERSNLSSDRLWGIFLNWGYSNISMMLLSRIPAHPNPLDEHPMMFAVVLGQYFYAGSFDLIRSYQFLFSFGRISSLFWVKLSSNTKMNLETYSEIVGPEFRGSFLSGPILKLLDEFEIHQIFNNLNLNDSFMIRLGYLLGVKLQRPSLLNKKLDFLYQNLKLLENFNYRVTIDPFHIQTSSADLLFSLSRHSMLQGIPSVVYSVGSSAQDVKGVTRDWLDKLSRSIISDFFIINEDQGFVPNFNKSQNMSIFCLYGIVMGLAIKTNSTIYCPFSEGFFSLVLGTLPKFSHIEFIDVSMWKLLNASPEEVESYQLSFEISIHGKDFCLLEAERDDIINTTFKDILEGIKGMESADVLVTADNYNLFKFLVSNTILHLITPIVKEISNGLSTIIPAGLLKIFDGKEMTKILRNAPIDIADWETNTEYINFSASDQYLVAWFWEIVKEMNLEQQQMLLKFVHGSSFLPPKGFIDLFGPDGVAKFTIILGSNAVFTENDQIVDVSDYLPTARICFNQLFIPRYKSKEQMQEKLIKAIGEEFVSEK